MKNLTTFPMMNSQFQEFEKFICRGSAWICGRSAAPLPHNDAQRWMGVEGLRRLRVRDSSDQEEVN
jgi:hypothetical protein